ncbi:MAG TPA: trypsin-like peptidase domain-containing protein [Candidatus Elarobacter sp.]|nr:trypsin-like peptidase domain-containing protein [Candidatus Elarobacter sp.]
MKSRPSIFGTAVVGLIGAIIGSFSMMLYASTHFAGVAGPGNTPPAVSAAPLPGGGTTDQDRIINAVKRVEPSVVALQVTVNGVQVVPTDPFAQFFGGGGGVQRQRVVERASGSGFVYSRNGLIVTNAHVVPRGTSKIVVVFANGDRETGHLFSSDPGADIALVKVDNYAKLPPPVEFADSTHLQAGQWAIAIGEPLALQRSVSVGVVSGFNRDEPIQDDNQQVHLFKGLLQTSAPINPGNSGGPLIDYSGRVIGVNQSTASPGSAQGIGFAIPSNTVQQTAVALAKTPGQTVNANSTGTGVGYLGVLLQPLDNGVRTQTGYHDQGGAVVYEVQSGQAADQAGLEPGDVVQAINGKPVNQPSDVTSVVKTMKPGKTVTLRVWSQGVKKNVSVKLGEQPADLYLQQQQGQSP